MPPNSNRAIQRERIDFRAIAAAARAHLPAIVRRWLPEGRREGSEWVARNPTRADRNLGSFKVNLRTGRWADFATGDGGGDLISLAAHLHGLSQVEAANKLATMLNLPARSETR
jgi:hypothetical protein